MPAQNPCPMKAEQIVDRYFIEHRAKLIDLAAFLDRVERGGGEPADEDNRLRAFRKGIGILTDGRPERARRILELLSDHTPEPIAEAHTQSALGADPNTDY
jgi:hypothetical protein